MRKHHHRPSEFLRDTSGQLSSKRLFALIAGSLVFVAAIGNMFFHVAIAEFIFHGLMYMAMVGIFGVAMEPFAAGFNSSNTQSADDDSGGMIGRSE